MKFSSYSVNGTPYWGAATEEGMVFLRESAISKALGGKTTLHEINKVTFVEVT